MRQRKRWFLRLGQCVRACLPGCTGGLKPIDHRPTWMRQNRLLAPRWQSWWLNHPESIRSRWNQLTINGDGRVIA